MDSSIPAVQSKKTIDAAGLALMVDRHTYARVCGSKADKFVDGIYSVSPDDFSFKSE